MANLTNTNGGELITTTRLPMDQNPAAVYLGSLQPVGRQGMRRSLNLIADLLTGGQVDCLAVSWAALRSQHTNRIRSMLIEKQYSPATVNHALSALRGVLRAAWQLGQMSAEDYQAAAAVKSVRGSTIPAGRELSFGELSALMAACEQDQTAAGARDSAIIALMYSCGLRRAEVITIALGDYDPETGRLVVNGKGNKQRTVYLANGALYAVNDWLPIRGAEGEPLFCAINKGGKLDASKPMAPQAIYNLLAKRREQAGVKEFSPHDLRRSFVSDLLDAGADIATVAKMAGHASVNTTARYDRRPEQAKQKAASLLHVPYREKKGKHGKN